MPNGEHQQSRSRSAAPLAGARAIPPILLSVAFLLLPTFTLRAPEIRLIEEDGAVRVIILSKTGRTTSGPYLGQKPPGLTPELFAPGIITSEISEGCSGWGNDREFFVFQRWIDRKSHLSIIKKKVNGVWTSQEPLPFARMNIRSATSPSLPTGRRWCSPQIG